MNDRAVSTGIYWDKQSWDLARSAYVADLDTDPESPDSWIGWLHRALDDHAARTPEQRAELAGTGALFDEVADPGKGFNRAHPFARETIEAMVLAIIDDRRQQGRVLSRSQFFREAVHRAAEQARVRRGHELPPPPAGRLPTRPPRCHVDRGRCGGGRRRCDGLFGRG